MTAGEPLALVLLHGFAGGPESFADFRKHLPSGHALFALTLPGHAGQPSVAGGFEGAVDWLAARAAQAAGGRVHLVGYSMGARLALGVAIRHPSTVGRLTLVGVHPGLADGDARRSRGQEDGAWALMIEEDLENFVRAWEERSIFESQRQLDEECLARQRATRLGHHPPSLASAMRDLGLGAMPDYSGALRRIEVPVDLVVGEYDQKFRAIAARMVGSLPRAQVHVVPGCGHNVVLERPSALAALIGASAAG